MKKLLCISLALIIVCSCMLCGCQTGKTEESSEAPAESSEVSTEAKLVPHLEKRDYSGRTLRILATYDDVPFGKEQFAATETNSEPVNDACYERNSLLKEEFGFDITTEFTPAYGEFIEKVRTDITAGSVNYDVVSTGVQALGSLAAEGKLLDLYSIENSNLCLDKDWWDVASNEDMSILGHLYFTTGDICILDDEYTRCVFYNKTIVSEKQLDNPTQLVFDKKWTLDAMYTMAKAAASEGGDNGVMDVTGTDVWGMVSAAFDTYSLVLGCDSPQIEKNKDDVPVLAMLNEKNANAFMKVFEIMKDKSCTAWTEQYYRWNDPNASTVCDNFYSNKALFLISTVNVVNTDKMRNAEVSYGILPMPKYSDQQENYATTINPYSFMCISLVAGCEDTDFVTYALEAMAYTSREIVTPEYYERTLKNKRFLDDNDSPEILDIIFSNRLVDLSVIFNWDDCIQYYNQIIVTDSPTLQSHIESHSDAFNAALGETLEVFRKSEAK